MCVRSQKKRFKKTARSSGSDLKEVRFYMKEEHGGYGGSSIIKNKRGGVRLGEGRRTGTHHSKERQVNLFFKSRACPSAVVVVAWRALLTQGSLQRQKAT